MWTGVQTCGALRAWTAIRRAQPPEEDVRVGTVAIEARDVSVLRRDEIRHCRGALPHTSRWLDGCASAAEIDAAMVQPFAVHRLGNGRQFAEGG